MSEVKSVNPLVESAIEATFQAPLKVVADEWRLRSFPDEVSSFYEWLTLRLSTHFPLLAELLDQLGLRPVKLTLITPSSKLDRGELRIALRDVYSGRGYTLYIRPNFSMSIRAVSKFRRIIPEIWLFTPPVGHPLPTYMRKYGRQNVIRGEETILSLSDMLDLLRELSKVGNYFETVLENLHKMFDLCSEKRVETLPLLLKLRLLPAQILREGAEISHGFQLHKLLRDMEEHEIGGVKVMVPKNTKNEVLISTIEDILEDFSDEKDLEKEFLEKVSYRILTSRQERAVKTLRPKNMVRALKKLKNAVERSSPILEIAIKDLIRRLKGNVRDIETLVFLDFPSRMGVRSTEVTFPWIDRRWDATVFLLLSLYDLARRVLPKEDIDLMRKIVRAYRILLMSPSFEKFRREMHLIGDIFFPFLVFGKSGRWCAVGMKGLKISGTGEITLPSTTRAMVYVKLIPAREESIEEFYRKALALRRKRVEELSMLDALRKLAGLEEGSKIYSTICRLFSPRCVKKIVI